MGDSPAWMGCRPHRDASILLCHLLHLRPSLRMLPFRRPRRRKEELYLHGRRPVKSGFTSGQDLWAHSIRKSVWSCYWLHHCLFHKYDGNKEVKLLPCKWWEEPMPDKQQSIHDHVWYYRNHFLSNPRF
nr:Amino acid permease 2 [Ipomoea batatas]